MTNANPPNDILQRASKIKLLALDVDGVLTDGRITYLADGQEIKSFFVQDGLGIKIAQQFGLVVAIITARDSVIVAHRARELGIAHVVQAAKNKREALTQLAGALGFGLDQCAFVGDDLPDLSAIEACGLGIAVANAQACVRERAHHLTLARGGKGAVREVCDLLLRAQGHWDAVLQSWR